MEFDEQDAIKFMRENASLSKNYTDDQILNIIDIIWDYYEDNGQLDITLDDDADMDVDPEVLIKHVAKMLRKDRAAGIEPQDIEPLVMAELDYEASL